MIHPTVQLTDLPTDRLADSNDEGGGNRTHDLEIKSLLLYQLSYALVAQNVAD